MNVIFKIIPIKGTNKLISNTKKKKVFSLKKKKCFNELLSWLLQNYMLRKKINKKSKYFQLFFPQLYPPPKSAK